MLESEFWNFNFLNIIIYFEISIFEILKGHCEKLPGLMIYSI